MIDSHEPLDPPLINCNVGGSWNRHEAVRQMSLGVELGLQFPFAPAIVALGDGEAERSVRLRLAEAFVAPLPRKKPRKKSVIRLTDHQQSGIVFTLFFEKYHADGAALECSPSFSVADLRLSD